MLETEYRELDIAYEAPRRGAFNIKRHTPIIISDYDWREAETDFRQAMKRVETKYLIQLRDKLSAGKINGNAWNFVSPHCGCFISTIGQMIIEDNRYQGKDNWYAFFNVYGDGDLNSDNMTSPFQEWLKTVRPGDTPQNHKVAKLFFDLICETIGIRIATTS